MNQFSILTTLVVSTTLILSLLGSTEAFSISTLKNPALVASRRPTVTTEKTLRHPSNLFETDNGLDEPSSDNTELIDKLSVEQRQELLQQAEAPLSKEAVSRRNLFINGLSIVLAGATGISAFSLFQQTVYTPKGFTRFAGTQFIAATGDPAATQGVIGSAKNEQWGVWTRDPGPRGVYLRDYSRLLEKDKVAPVGWAFDPNDWWLEEHGTKKLELDGIRLNDSSYSLLLLTCSFSSYFCLRYHHGGAKIPNATWSLSRYGRSQCCHGFDH